jgi:dipeptidyl aminopeptidase/acylaminoacyl peptidase
MIKWIKIFCIIFVLAVGSCNRSDKNQDSYFFFEPLTQTEIKDAKLTPEILWKFGRITDSKLSDDGNWIVYCVRRYSVSKNQGNTEIFKIPSHGGTPVELTNTAESEANICWRHDNNKIGFLSPLSGSSQLWEMNPDGSEKRQISETDMDIESFEYSPGGKYILFTCRVKTDSSVQDKYPDLPESKAISTDIMMFRHWDSWTDYKHSHVFYAEYNDGKISNIKDIMPEEPFDAPLAPYFESSQISWSPDDKIIAYTCKKLLGRDYALSTNSDIYLYYIDSGKTVNISEGMPGYDRFPVFSPDGQKIAWQSMATPGYESDKDRLMIMDLKSRIIKDYTTSIEEGISNIIWSGDGRELYFISGIKATYQVWNLNIASGKINKLTNGWHDYFSLERKKDVMIGQKMSMSMATEIFKISDKGEEQQLTFTNKNIYDSINLGTVKDRWVTTTDKKKMLVWVVYPPFFDPSKKYPALLFCEGGPQSAVSQFFSYRWNLQLMAANGYIVIAPNRRGLPTFGKQWNDQITGDYGGQNVKDYMSAVDDMKKEAYIDPSRIGAAGASYGGYSVFYLAGCHKNRFKAFLAHCGIFNFESQYAATEELFFPNHDLEGAFWNIPRPKSYDFSPHLFIRNWNTPIMIVTGANDFRIPYTEGIQAFDAAQLRGIPSKLLFFPDEGHWILKPQNSILWQREYFNWFNKWLK